MSLQQSQMGYDETVLTTMDSNANSEYSEHDRLLFPSKYGSYPGFASEQTLSRGLQIPSKSYRLTSGFEYPTVLTKYNVTQEDWSRFSHEITEHAKLSPQQWRTVIGIGIGVMAIGGMMLGVFGAIPAVMVARQKRANQESRNLAAAMSPFSAASTENEKEDKEAKIESENSLSHKLTQWNETYFQPRGLLIRIDMPYDMSALEDGLDVAVETSCGSNNNTVRSSPSSSRSGSVSSLSKQKKDDRRKTQREAKDRCRIVIIPLNQHAESIMSQATTLAEESFNYIPAVYD